MPRISVIVPLYNKSLWIDRCLDAIQSQTLDDFEIIVVDDGSTDLGPAKVAARHDSRLTLISQANAGPGAARNHGVRLASSPLVAFLDADDAWRPDYLAESVRRMDAASPETASLAWGSIIHPRGESTETRWKEAGVPAGEFRAGPDSSPATIIAILGNMYPSANVMRKVIFEDLGGYYEKDRCLYSEDAWLYLKMLLKYRALFDARPLSIRFEDASELENNLHGVRPIEPFLTHPESLTADCPGDMQTLLRDVLVRRALKTASVYGYWGKAEQARQLIRRFASPSDWRLPWFASALVGATPFGGFAGKLARLAGYRKG